MRNIWTKSKLRLTRFLTTTYCKSSTLTLLKNESGPKERKFSPLPPRTAWGNFAGPLQMQKKYILSRVRLYHPSERPKVLPHEPSYKITDVNQRESRDPSTIDTKDFR